MECDHGIIEASYNLPLLSQIDSYPMPVIRFVIIVLGGQDRTFL